MTSLYGYWITPNGMDIKEIINRDFAETAPTRSRSGTEDGEVLQNSLNRSQIDKANTSSIWLQRI